MKATLVATIIACCAIAGQLHAKTQQERLYEIYGITAQTPTPGAKVPPQKANLIAYANMICQGKHQFYGSETVDVGRQNIDWFGGQKKHQEWVAQLNRFFVLETLVKAWQLSGNPQYPQRARVLIEDYCNFMDKHDGQFVDPQRNNLLNLSIRISNWSTAYLAFQHTEPFDQPFKHRMMTLLRKQTDGLCQRTKPGDSNFQVVQSSTLIRTALLFPQAPEAETWKQKGMHVLEQCFKRQFRPDGTHVENTTGYHTWMLSQFIQSARLKKEGFLPNLTVPEQVIRGGIDFTYLSAPFAFNDSSYWNRGFPKWNQNVTQTCQKLARKAGLEDYAPPPRKLFPDAGFVFGGNQLDRFCFDASDHGGRWHSHYSRLAIALSSYGYLMVLDPAITTYERTDEVWYEFGRGTPSHPCLTFSGANQNRGKAKLDFAHLRDDWSLVSAEYNEGFNFMKVHGWKTTTNPQVQATQRRTILHLPEEYMLVFDQAKVMKSTRNDLKIQINFPVIPSEKWSFDPTTLTFQTQNRKRPNLTLKLLWHQGNQVTGSCVEGQRQPETRGWVARKPETVVPCPAIRFEMPASQQNMAFVTLAAPRPIESPAPDYKVLNAQPGQLDLLRPDGGKDCIRYAQDFKSPETLTVGKATRSHCIFLLVRTNPDGTIAKILDYPEITTAKP